MKQVNNMSQAELAAYIQDALQVDRINVVLSGGSAVSFYSNDKYVSKDLDLINTNFARRSKIRSVMGVLGFHEQGRYFISPETHFFVEFPNGPLSVGEEPVKEISKFELATGTLRVVSATDCVKDRLCAFYFWNDQQGLVQAVLVAESQNVDLAEVERWSKVEDKELVEYSLKSRTHEPQKEGTGQVEINFAYRRHVGGRFMHGSVKLRFDGTRSSSFSSFVVWPEDANYESYVKAGVEGTLCLN